MPKRVKHGRRPTDINQIAHQLVEQSTAEPESVIEPPKASAILSQYMAAIGKKGGKIGGKRRLTTMTAKQRKKIAAKAANARWAAKTRND
jgi:hypothetical protein